MLVCKGNDKRKIYFIDQHAVHERIRYECYISAFLEGRSDESGWLKSSRSFNLKDCILKRSLTSILPQIQSLLQDRERLDTYFDCTLQDNKPPTAYNISALRRSLDRMWVAYRISMHACTMTYRLHVESCPSVIAKMMTPNAIASMLNDDNDDFLPRVLTIYLGSMSCHGAIRFMDTLTDDDCQAIIHDMKAVRDPMHCVHGRRSMFSVVVE